MKAPNPAYFPPYQSATSMRMATNLQTKPSNQKLVYNNMPMYNSAVTPSSSSNSNNSPSVNSVLKLFPNPSNKQQLDTSPSSFHRQHQNFNDYSMDTYQQVPSSTNTNKLQSVQKWKIKQDIYKQKLLQLGNNLVVKDSLISGFQQIIETQSNSESSVKKLTTQLSESKQQVRILRQRIHFFGQQDKQLKNKQEEIKKLKTTVQELQNKQLTDLYSTNVSKMNKDKQFYVFKLIECQNTLRQRDSKIAELEKIQKILMKQMDEVKNKTHTDKTMDVKKYIQRQEQLMKTITNHKVQLYNKDIQTKKSKATYDTEIQILKQKYQQIKNTLDKTIKQSQINSAQIKIKNVGLEQRLKQMSQQQFQLINRDGSQQKVQLLQSKLLTVLKQMQITNNEYQQYKIKMVSQFQSLTFTNSKLLKQINQLQISNQKLRKLSEDFMTQIQENKKSRQQNEKVLSTANISAIKRITELQHQLKNVKSIVIEKQKQVVQLQKIIAYKTNIKSQPTDISTTLKLQNELLLDKIKVLELKTVQHDFNSKLIQNLQTQNKYIKETVKIQTAEIGFLKKQHLQVIESMINLNQKKNIDEISPQKQKYSQLNEILDKHEKVYKDSKNVDFFDVFQQLNKFFDKKYSFLKITTPQSFSPRPNISTNDQLQHSGSFQQQMTMTIFYEQHFKGLLMLFDIQQGEGCQADLNDKIKELMNSNIRLEQQNKNMILQIQSFSSSTKHVDIEIDKKNKTIEQLSKMVSKLQSNVSVAVQKLIKYQALLEDANKTIISNELLVFSSKHELMSIKETFKTDKQSFLKQIHNLQTYLKQVLKTVADPVKQITNIQGKTLEQINKINIILYKLFLKQASQDNIHLNQYISKVQSGVIGDEMLSLKYSVLWDIKQYYRNLLLPEIQRSLNKSV